MMMSLDEAIALIEGCDDLPALRIALQRITEDHGFASYGFVDAGAPGNANPLWIATSHPQWVEDYRTNGFVHDDPAVAAVRRTNVPFLWSDVPLPRRTGKRKPTALRIMEAARDFGFSEGLVVPFHFVDRLGRSRSMSCGFYWRERKRQFLRLPPTYRIRLHILMIYWSQRVMDISARAERISDRQAGAGAASPPALTDRERHVLEWAARGKTAEETASILSISANTVETHIRNAVVKLEASNKTHAAAKAVQAGLIDL